MAEHDFSGVWRSIYQYHSSSRNADFENEHYLKAYQKGNVLTLETLPKVNRSYVTMRLSANDNIATGTWEETTDPDGPYKGATYNGAIQLVVAADANTMDGKWVGFGKNMDINTGKWSLTYVGAELPAGVDSTKPERAV
jgi:Na+-translocating ferredoxin:NAD+ oxidoreductase RnfG subunit